MVFSFSNTPETCIPVTLQKAFDNTTNRLAKTSGELKDINTSDIASCLIQECGRWAESYSSDMLVTWNIIQRYLDGSNPPPEDGHLLFIFGIRRNGVDGPMSVMARITQGIGPFNHYLDTELYRRILGLEINIADNMCSMTLKNIEHQLGYLNKKDEPLVLKRKS